MGTSGAQSRRVHPKGSCMRRRPGGSCRAAVRRRHPPVQTPHLGVLARCRTCGSVPQTVRLRPQHFERDCITEEGFHATSQLLDSQPWASHWACLACGFNVGNRTTHKTFAVGDRRAGGTVHGTCSPRNLARVLRPISPGRSDADACGDGADGGVT